jgi:hypothetical protein
MNKIDRWIELSFIEDVKILQKYGINEYYNKANTGLYEFLNPELSYPYSEENMSDGQKMWKVEKQDNDPQFLVTLKNGMGGEFFILDFYFYEGGFDKQQGLEGKHYLDTLTKIIKDNIIPYFISSSKSKLYFNAYNGDNEGKTRQKIFIKIIDKFIDKNKFNIENRNEDFIITKK